MKRILIALLAAVALCGVAAYSWADGARHGHGTQPEAHCLAVHDAAGDGLLFESLPMAVGDLAALSVGAPVERAAVIAPSTRHR